MVNGAFTINGKLATLYNNTTAVGYEYPYFYRLYNDSGYSHTAKDLRGEYGYAAPDWASNGAFYNDTSGTQLEIVYDNAITGADMFDGCTSLSALPDNCFNNVEISDWMFDNCRSLSAIPTNSFKKLTRARHMFYACDALTSIPTFDNVTDALGMFWGCDSLSSIPEYSFNKVTKSTHMFYSCSGLITVPEHCFSSIITGSVTFDNCTNLTGVHSKFYNMTKADGMFSDASKLTHVENDAFSAATDTSYMFVNCASLRDVSQIDFHNSVVAWSMFENCNSLSAFDPTMFNNVEDAHKMFANCKALTPASFNVTAGFEKVKDVRGMFSGCSYLKIKAMDFIRAHSATVTANQGCFYLAQSTDEYEVLNSPYRSWVTSA